MIASPPSGWPAMAQQSDRVVAYTLEAKLDPTSHTIEGKERLVFRNTSTSSIRDLRMHLYLNAFKNDSTLFHRARIGSFRGTEKHAPGFIDVKRLRIDGVDLWPKHEWVSPRGKFPQDVLPHKDKPVFEGAPDDETDVRIPLERAVETQQTISIDIEFYAQLPEITERTGYYKKFHFAGQWFPKLARLEPDGTWASFPFHHLGEFYADYGTYDVTLDVPADFTIGASGLLRSSTLEKGRRIERYTIEDVHDFAWVTWDQFVVQEAKEGPVAIRHLAPPGYEAIANREIRTAIHGLRDMGARFGEYPYSTLTIVAPPKGADEAGGMEYPTLITTGQVVSATPGIHATEVLTIHELGHQWFYGLIGSNEVEWPAGDEGLNSFAELLTSETLMGSASVFSSRIFDLSLVATDRRGTSALLHEPIFQPVYAFASGSSYGSRVYAATAIVLDTFRRSCDASKVDMALGIYARKYRFKHPKPDDFFRELEPWVNRECVESLRVSLTTPSSYDVFVHRLETAPLHKPSGLFDTIQGRIRESSGIKTDLHLNSVWVGRSGQANWPIEVELRFKNGSRRKEIFHFDSASQWKRLDYDGPSSLIAVVVDPDFKISMDRDRSNNFNSISGYEGKAPIAQESSLAWFQYFARGVGP